MKISSRKGGGFVLACMLVVTILLGGCAYGFKGISIPPDVNTFSVDNFRLSALAAPQAIEITFSEALRDKVRSESRLKYNADNPDVLFSGSVTSYQVSPQAPQEGSATAFNRLTIGVKVNYESLKNEEDNWSKSFSFFADFDAAQDLATTEDELINQIFEQLVEQIFNAAFTNW